MRILINGYYLNYILSGPEGAPVVTLSHSIATSINMWRPQLSALECRYQLLRLDTRGHGNSDAPDGPYSMESLADDTFHLLQALGIQRTHFIGLSLGGMIGQILAFKHPDLCESLVLCNTISEVRDEAKTIWRERAALAELKGMVSLVDSTLDRWFTNSIHRTDPGQVDTVRQMILRTPVDGFSGCCHAIQRFNMTDKLSSIEVPALVIAGREDCAAPMAAAELICEQLPNARLQVIDEAAHLSNIEQADIFNKFVGNFLDSMSHSA